MSDLISRQDAIDAIDKMRLDRDARNDYEFGCEDMLDWAEFMVEDLPSEDGTIERKKGEWINVTNGRGGMECSNCHAYSASYKNGDDYLSNFCPNCGARMEGKR